VFEWQDFRDQSQTLSLYSRQRLIEIRVPSGRLGEGGTAALLDFLAELTPDTVLMVLMGRLDKRTQSSRWFKAAETAGVVIDARPVSLQQLPHWIDRRLRAHDIVPAREVSDRLAYYVEGNLLAASQEVAKLSLLLGPGAKLDLQILEAIVADPLTLERYESHPHQGMHQSR
jgi:DNA polymerase-3 subunit delta